MNRNPLELKKIDSGDTCNSRTKRGYCQNVAGFKTKHYGSGRCFLHGGRPRMNSITKINDSVLQSIYSKALPTNLMIELSDLKSDPYFISLTQELGLLKIFVNSLLQGLPAELSSMFGKPICKTCSDDVSVEKDGTTSIVIDVDYREQRELLNQIIKIVSELSKVFEKLSRHEEKLGKFITVSELETIFMRWGRILVKHFQGHPNLEECQKEILNCGWLRDPTTEKDYQRLDSANEIRTKVIKKVQKIRSKKIDYSNATALAEVLDEFLLDEEKGDKNNKVVDAMELLKRVKKD